MEEIHKNLPRDVFVHLLSLIALIASAVSLGVLLFQYVNVYLPDIVADPYFSPSSYFSIIRDALAVLIVVFPIYIWSVMFIQKDLSRNPAKRELKIRKWLLYFTLFVAALVITGDLVSLLRGYLQGELTARFILKSLAIILIAGSIFLRYFEELKERSAGSVKVLSGIAIGAVAAVIIAGFVIAGTPKSQRLVRLDERRVNDLSMIQGQIVNFWQLKSRLPRDLSELEGGISGTLTPVDPVSGVRYTYGVISPLKFKLCADFQTDNGNTQSRGPKTVYPEPYGSQTWEHGTGVVCFERSIDPTLIRPYPKAL